ncbi:alpha/beta fold hydrolase [Amycolatopsis thermoflava]|uniref:alpha/beta fold hydrolase n=1 Tax=Amycolatopsis thermoflava TaxID=84480 RepID=UPI003820E1C2
MIALAPIGFWHPLRGRCAAAILRHSATLSRAMPGRGRRRLLRSRFGRTLSLFPFSARPGSVGVDEAVTLATTLAHSDIAAMSRYTGRYRFRGSGPIGAPVTLVWAGRDRLLGRVDARRAAQRLPHALQVLIPGSGHRLATDAPDEITSLVLRATGCGHRKSNY